MTEDQVTKPLPRERFEKLRCMLGITQLEGEVLRISRGVDQACKDGEPGQHQEAESANDLSKETKLRRSEGKKFSITVMIHCRFLYPRPMPMLYPDLPHHLPPSSVINVGPS
jgi:hypothetical protein